MPERTKFEALVEELVRISAPDLEWHLGKPDLDGAGWERRVKSLCGQIFTQGMSVGWDKYHNALAEYVGECKPDGGEVHGQE